MKARFWNLSLVRLLSFLLLTIALMFEAHGSGQCHQYYVNVLSVSSGYFDTADAACSDAAAKAAANGYFSAAGQAVVNTTVPSGYYCHITWPYLACPRVDLYHNCLQQASGDSGNSMGDLFQEGNVDPSVCGSFYISNLMASAASCGPWCNGVGHPINPATGAVYDTIADVTFPKRTLALNHFYNSTDTSNTDLSTGWRRTYSRVILAKYSTIATQNYLQSASNSSRYNNPDAACTSGFSEIRSKVPQWTDALVSYSNGNCVLTKNGSYVGAVTVKASGGSFAPAPTPVAYDAIRDDGQWIRFIVDGNGAIIGPPGVGLKLLKTSAGFTAVDGADNVEQYDANGKLLTVTSRGGVVQTMSYDGSGRLSGVTDSFGHQLIFNYDDQGRLSLVAKD